LALLLTVVLLFIATMTDIATVPVWILLGLVGACIILLFGSIIYQQALVKESVEAAPAQIGRSRMQRRVRAPRSRPETHEPARPPLPVKRPIRKGPLPQTRPAKAVKIIQGR